MHASGAKFDALNSLNEDLRFAMITSGAKVYKVVDEANEKILVKASAHTKCDRCWHYREDVGVNAEHPSICGRCVSNLFGQGEQRTHA